MNSIMNDHILSFQILTKIKFGNKYIHFCPKSTGCKNPKEEYLCIFHIMVNNDVASVDDKVKRTYHFDHFVNNDFASCPL
jgi:hypothetical protein